MNLLFVCTHNACRSILAESITRQLAGDRIRVASAGSQPAGSIHPLTLDYLQSVGLPTGELRSKGFDDLGEFRPDVVITVCNSAANESCPVWLSDGSITAHWGLPDPSHLNGSDAERQAAFQSVADTLQRRMQALLSRPFESLSKDELRELLNTLGSC